MSPLNNSGQKKKLKPAVVCLAAGKSQLIVIEKAKELGYAVLAVDRDPHAPGFKLSDEMIQLSTSTAGPIIDRLQMMREKYNIVGVLNRSSGLPVVTAAQICQAMKLRSTPPESAQRITDKAKLLATCKAHGIPVPDFHSVQTFREIDEQNLRFPCVVKPALSLVGKSGVRIVAEPNGLRSAFEAAHQVSMTGIVNIEDYIPGYDFSLLAIIIDRAVHKIILRDEWNVVDKTGAIEGYGIAMPSVFSGMVEESRIIELAQRVTRRFELNQTVLNLCCRCEPAKGPVLIEIHLDMGGDLFYDALVPESTESDLVGIMIKALTGELSDLPDVAFNPVALVFNHSFSILKATSPSELRQMIKDRSMVNGKKFVWEK